MCKKTTLKKAIQFCETNKHRLTEPRLEVLKIIAANDRPQGAYNILEQLGKVIKNPKPPTAYRAIEFWMEHGFIHRIESLNAYIACDADHQHKGAQFLICDSCHKVTETHHCQLPEALQSRAEKLGFTPAKWNLEIHGHCADCQSH
jgi:Fur family zinc uptake transcriptional regulator